MVAKVINAEEAAGLIKDGATLTVAAQSGSMLADKVLGAIEVRYLAEGHPRGLVWFDPNPTAAGPGFEHFAETSAHEGLLKRVIQSWFVSQPRLCALIKTNKVEGYCFPLQTGHYLMREIGAGRKGYLTKVGLHTAIDPRQGGGRLNSRTTEDLVEVRQFDGEEWLWYKGSPINVAIIRGTTADEVGNIGFEEEPRSLGVLNQAQAAKSSGGIVIAQVKRPGQEGGHPSPLRPGAGLAGGLHRC